MSKDEVLLNPPLSSANVSVKGRYFLITGGTQGLGYAIAEHLRDLGASGLILVSRSTDKGLRATQTLTKQEKTTSGECRIYFIQADLSIASEAESVFPRAEELLGPSVVISGVVNAAAITERGNLFSTTAQGFDRQMAINVRAPFLITQGAARHFTTRRNNHHHPNTNNTNLRGGGGGSIVNIISVASHGGAPFVMAYSVSKAALVALTKNNAAELAPQGIRVNGINMGWCLTDNENTLQISQSNEQWIERADASVPLGRILRPADVARTVGFLLSDASAMMTASIIDLHPEFPHGMLSLADHDAR